jgi:YVTN family beta-propeller protein
MIIMSVVLLAYNNVDAQTFQSITQQRKLLEGGPQITVGDGAVDIAINGLTNKIYVANMRSNSVSVIDSNSGSMKTIRVGVEPGPIAIDDIANKVYVANIGSNSISVIDGYDDSKIKDIPVEDPTGLVYNGGVYDKIFVSNSDSISVIDTHNDSKVQDIPVRDTHIDPYSIIFQEITSLDQTTSIHKIYVRGDDDLVYVINATHNGNTAYSTVTSYKILHVIKSSPVWDFMLEIVPGDYPNIYAINKKSVSQIDTKSDIVTRNIKIDRVIVGASNKYYINPSYGLSEPTSHIYIVSASSSDVNATVSVINGDTGDHYGNITVGKDARDIVAGAGKYSIGEGAGKYYVVNLGSNTISVINSTTDTKERDIPVGKIPSVIGANGLTHMIYVLNQGSNSVSVIDPSSDKVQAGVKFNIDPSNSGKIICNNSVYPTGIYLYVDAGLNCTAQPNNGFLFNTWTVNLPTSRNSSIPLDSSGNLTINRYGTFTVNFKPTFPPEYWSLIITIIVTTIIGWSIPTIASWVKAETQRKHLRECVDQIGKLDKSGIEDKMKGYYVQGKISEDHRQFLKDKISEYYEEEKGSK